MKKLGYWGKHDVCVRCGQYIYNISIWLDPNRSNKTERPKEELPQAYLDILEKREWSVCDYTDDGRVELEWYSPAGEDFIVCVKVENFPDEILDYSDSFDPDEHLFDGPETIEGLLAEHYTLSWALASLRDKLKHYEDALIPEIMPEGLQTIDRAIGTYGKDAQLTKAVEEMSELTKALCKLKECKRKYDTPFNRETQEVYSNVEEETADVFIMLVQLFAIFNPHELVNITKIVWDKLDRLKDNLDKEAAKQEASDAGKK